MSDSTITYTPTQATAIEDLVAAHEDAGEIVAQHENGTIEFRIGDRDWTIGPRGAVHEISTPSAGDVSGDTSSGDIQPNPSDVPSEAPQATDSGGASYLPASPEPPATDAYQAMTAADERQIMAEIEGRALDSMVYSFRQGNSTVTGLSWKGTQEAIRQMNTRGLGRIKVTSQPPVFEEVTIKVDGEERKAVRCTVYAEDEVHGSGRWGTAVQTHEQKTKSRGWLDDPFATTKALSKAQRNAMEGMLPLELVEELKTAYLGRGKVEYIDSVATELPDLPPALTDDKAKALGDEIRELYSEFKRLHPEGQKAMTAGEFNRYFEAAQHDHQRLEDFKGFMQQRVDEAKEAAA
jgi:hypothetical protein